MGVYKVSVWTGDAITASTFDSISIVLVGTEGESAKSALDHFGKDFMPNTVDEYDIEVEENLGAIILIKLYKEKYGIFPNNDWYCSKVTVETPAGALYHFPCYRWIQGYTVVDLPEGRATLPADRTNPILIKQAEDELKERQNDFKWKVYYEGYPKIFDLENGEALDSDLKYSIIRSLNYDFKAVVSYLEITLAKFFKTDDSWDSFDKMKRLLFLFKTDVSEYVADHWKEDSLFGDQFLNGVDPNAIEKINKIPDNFPVTNEMVACSLGSSMTLEKALEDGKIFLADYKCLDGMDANVINGKQQYMAAPLCLLYSTPEDTLMPLAIQIQQTPGPENPIFLPSDCEWDWVLAKMWVRNAYFNCHEALEHSLRTHAFPEVFTIATLRQLPLPHPLYKLLIPHVRYTLQTNEKAREVLVGPGRAIDTVTSIGNKGYNELIAQRMKSITYSSLILPENLTSRGVDSLPKFYYQEDGLKIWSAIESFVAGIVDHYYKGDDTIMNDPELQAWVAEIFKEGFLENQSSGVPTSLDNRADLIKYLTMVIFNCSAQHAVVNNGQFDFYAWVPNSASTMRQPPPTSKGTATVECILETLPDVAVSTALMVTVWSMSNELGHKHTLGTYEEEYFTEEEPKLLMEAFHESMSQISAEIEARNASQPLQYNYLNPKQIDSSLAM